MNVTARVLVVAPREAYPDIGTQLEAQGYASRTAHDFEEARALSRETPPDIAIVAAMGPDDPRPANVGWALGRGPDDDPLPILYIADADTGGEAPLDDGLTEYLSPSFSEIELLARLRGLTRLATMREELNRRAATTRSYGVQGQEASRPPTTVSDARLLLVAENDVNVAPFHATLGREAALALVPDREEAVQRLERDSFDALLAFAVDGAGKWLDLFHSIRGNSRLYNLPILVITKSADEAFKADAFAAGVNDVLAQDAPPEEVAFRVTNQVRQQRYRLSMQAIYREARHLVTSDSLTGLYTRGFLQAHLATQLAEAEVSEKPLTLAIMKLETLSSVNQTLGYAAGDQLLRQVGGMIGTLVRGEDLAARHRGDTYAVVMPDTILADARIVTGRLCGVVNNSSYALPDAASPVTTPLTTCCVERVSGDSADTLLRRARLGLKG